MQVKNAATKEDLKKRLRRIEGQVRGVEKMVDDDRDCHEIIQQLAAIRAAVQQASLLVVRSYASQCLLEVHDGESQQAIIEDLIGVLSKTT
ncbi:MAG TPA: metal-sensitive transcriptional regulator [Anaerolineales bacterium]|nr:metal-sensitive transcriptional regulator [Anaerolineales bacterium]